MIVGWLVSFCASIALMGLWYLCRKVQQSWVGPGGMLCGVWFFGTLLPLFFAAYFPVNPAAYLMILGFAAVGAAGSSLPVVFADRTAPRQEYRPEQMQVLRRMYWLTLAIGSLTPVALFASLVSQFGHLPLLELAARVTVARYSGDFAQSLGISLLTMVLFFCALIGGALAGLSNERPWNLKRYLAWLIPLLACSVMQTTKASVMFGGGLFGAALITGIVQRGGEAGVRLKPILVSISVLCGIAFLFVFAGLRVRYGAFGSEDADTSFAKSTIYFVGHMGVLGVWMHEGGIGRAACSGGAYTFGGLFEMAGLHQRLQGLFDDMIEFDSGGGSNIYTAFRSAIEDFTLPGAFLFIFSISFLGGLGWVGLRKGKLSGSFLFLGYLAYVLLSPITSVFVYNTNVGALALFGLLMWGVTFVCRRPAPLKVIQNVC